MLEIGDKVVIKKTLRPTEYYGGVYFSSIMVDYKGKEFVISEVNKDYDPPRYKLEGIPSFVWSEDMFLKKTKKEIEVKEVVVKDNSKDIKELSEAIEKLSKKDNSKVINDLKESINKLSDKIESEDPFKKAMLEGIIEKGKELAVEDLKKELKSDLDKFIQETYGVLPKKIVVENNGVKKEVEGIFHKDFEKICKIVNSNIPLMLVGGAGAGKNYTLEQVAQALDLTFYTTNAVNQDYKLTGFIDANGVYHETEFYKAFVNGGMFFLDEIDASCPEALVTLNSAIANKYFDFPTGRKVAHKDFRVVCAGPGKFCMKIRGI